MIPSMLCWQAAVHDGLSVPMPGSGPFIASAASPLPTLPSNDQPIHLACSSIQGGRGSCSRLQALTAPRSSLSTMPGSTRTTCSAGRRWGGCRINQRIVCQPPWKQQQKPEAEVRGKALAGGT